MQWKQTFFQAVATVNSPNFRVDRLVMMTSHNVIIMVESKIGNQESIVHVYSYKNVSKSVEMNRLQIFSTSLNANHSHIYLFHEYNSYNLYLMFCDPNLSATIAENQCEYFIWRTDGIENTSLFQPTEKFELLKSLPSGRTEETNQQFISKDIFAVVFNVIFEKIKWINTIFDRYSIF